jgi:hypothetical protein
MRRAGHSAGGASGNVGSLRLERVACTGAVLCRPAGRGRVQGPAGEHKFRPLEAKPNDTQIYEGTSQIQRMGMARQLLKGLKQAAGPRFLGTFVAQDTRRPSGAVLALIGLFRPYAAGTP